MHCTPRRGPADRGFWGFCAWGAPLGSHGIWESSSPHRLSPQQALNKPLRKAVPSGESVICLLKSGRSECSWGPPRDVSQVVNSLNVSIHYEGTLQGQSNFHNHCRLTPPHCLGLLPGQEEDLPHFQRASVWHWWKRSWKSPPLEAEAWRHSFPCESGSEDFLDCLGGNRSKGEEDQRAQCPLEYFSLRLQIQNRTSEDWMLAPDFQMVSVCLTGPAAILHGNRKNVLTNFLSSQLFTSTQ